MSESCILPFNDYQFSIDWFASCPVIRQNKAQSKDRAFLFYNDISARQTDRRRLIEPGPELQWTLVRFAFE